VVPGVTGRNNSASQRWSSQWPSAKAKELGISVIDCGLIAEAAVVRHYPKKAVVDGLRSFHPEK